MIYLRNIEYKIYKLLEIDFEEDRNAILWIHLKLIRKQEINNNDYDLIDKLILKYLI